MNWEIARISVYLLTALIGAVLIIWGMVHGDAAMMVTGAGYLGVGGLAGANTRPRSGGDHAAE